MFQNGKPHFNISKGCHFSSFDPLATNVEIGIICFQPVMCLRFSFALRFQTFSQTLIFHPYRNLNAAFQLLIKNVNIIHIEFKINILNIQLSFLYINSEYTSETVNQSKRIQSTKWTCALFQRVTQNSLSQLSIEFLGKYFAFSAHTYMYSRVDALKTDCARLQVKDFSNSSCIAA